MLGHARRRHLRRGRLLTLLLALLATQLGSLMAPAYACGCGPLVPGDHQRVTAGREVSVVRRDGAQEQIVMSLSVSASVPQVPRAPQVPRPLPPTAPPGPKG
ncbi:DUF2330 domain-containing protein [Streptomyces bobili]|uniref:DUF2330 domain-containing protein n=1 Tax=Streptomyces bobili TaxID=67280 RepID=UPI00339F4221